MYLGCVETNLPDVGLLWNGSNAKKRYSNMLERINILSIVADWGVTNELKKTLVNQPIFTEYNRKFY